MERINEDSGVRDERPWPMKRRLLASLGGITTAAKRGEVPVYEVSDVPAAPERAAEPHAGYYVASQNRPAFVTDLTSDEIREVFDLVDKVATLPSKHITVTGGSSETEGGQREHLPAPSPGASRTG